MMTVRPGNRIGKFIIIKQNNFKIPLFGGKISLVNGVILFQRESESGA
jgi:hypothetical protein